MNPNFILLDVLTDKGFAPIIINLAEIRAITRWKWVDKEKEEQTYKAYIVLKTQGTGIVESYVTAATFDHVTEILRALRCLANQSHPTQ